MTGCHIAKDVRLSSLTPLNLSEGPSPEIKKAKARNIQK